MLDSDGASGRYIAEDILDEITRLRIRLYNENETMLCRALGDVQTSLYEHVQETRLFCSKFLIMDSFIARASPRLRAWMGLE